MHTTLPRLLSSSELILLKLLDLLSRSLDYQLMCSCRASTVCLSLSPFPLQLKAPLQCFILAGWADGWREDCRYPMSTAIVPLPSWGPRILFLSSCICSSKIYSHPSVSVWDLFQDPHTHPNLQMLNTLMENGVIFTQNLHMYSCMI